MSVRRRRKDKSTGGGSKLGARFALTVLGIAVFAFGVGYAISAFAFTTAAAPADVVLVPDLREMSLAEATRRVEREGLTLAIGDSLPNREVAAGAVLAQTPLPGNEVGAGAEVRIILSTGPVKAPVPDVSTMSIALATRALETAGFTVRIEEAPGKAEPGEVAGVEPQAGTPIELPAEVVLYVGALPPFVFMPDLVGSSEDAAREALEAAGLVIDEVRYESVSNMTPYTVVAQEPMAGDSIDTGSAVRLRVTMPDVDRPFDHRNRFDEGDEGDADFEGDRDLERDLGGDAVGTGDPGDVERLDFQDGSSPGAGG